MLNERTEGSAARLTAVEIGNCADRLAAILRRCPIPSDVDGANINTVQRLLEESNVMLEALLLRRRELMGCPDLGPHELDLYITIPALITAHRQMAAAMSRAIAEAQDLRS